MEVKKRKIGNTYYYLEAVMTDEGVDFVYSSDNWCSGYLLAQYYWSLEEIWENFTKEDLRQWDKDAWEAHSESLRPC